METSPFPSASIALALAAMIALIPPPRAVAQTDSLTPQQAESIRKRLEDLRIRIEGRNTALNQSAGEVFRQASQDPKAAVRLYARCCKEVNFDREGREDSEYRDWEDKQKNNFRDPQFVEGLMVQLRYLALSCDAAETEKLEEVFPALLAYVEGLGGLKELPSQRLLQGIGGSVFAQAYRLEELLAKNESYWEMVPFNIAGIYDKTVLPYLRVNEPSKLMPAWDRRIAQQTRLVAFFAEMEDSGTNREQRRAAENRNRRLQEGRSGAIVRAHDEDDFREKTLPALRWERLKDMALYVNATEGVGAMLAFVEEQAGHPKVSDWIDELNNVLNQLEGAEKAAPVSSLETTPSA